MERLTKRISENIIELSSKANLIQYNGNPQRVHVKHPFWNVFNRLCEYEDLEEKGLLLKLPCKVGDTIYSIGTRCDFGEAPDGGCDEMDCGDCYCSYDLIIKERAAKDFHIRRFLDGTSDYDFLTKAEAEKALAEMEHK